MNGSTAKLLRKYAHLSGYNYRKLKRIYKTFPGPERYDVKQEIRFEIVRLTAKKEAQKRAKKEYQEEKQESVVPIHSRPAANDPTVNQSPEPANWWWGFWEWLKGFVWSFD